MTRVSITRKINVRDPSVLPLWAQGAAVQEWIEIDGTALSSVAPSPVDTRYGRPEFKIGGWNGATLKRSGSVYMLGAAGGHGDYAGNEVNAIDLSLDAPAWTELKARSAVEDIYIYSTVNRDLTRSSPHNYWATQFDQVNNRMLICSGGGPWGTGIAAEFPNEAPTDPMWPWRTGAGSTPAPDPVVAPLMGFDLASGEWTPPEGVGSLGLMPVVIGTADLVCANPITNEIFVNKPGSGALYKYNATTGSWTNVGSWYLNGGYAGSAVDPTRDRMLVVGDFGGSRDPFVRSTLNASAVSVTFGGLGAAALRMSGYPGVVYDEDNDRFLVFKNDNPITVYSVNAADFTVSLLTTTGTTPAQRQNGIHNSVQYAPELRGVVMANSYTGNVKFMRIA